MREPIKGRVTTRGFSLIELLVVVVILGVIVVASIPGILRYLPRYRVDRVAENLCQAVRMARDGAVTAHCNYVVRFWQDFQSTTPAVGMAVAYDVWIDRNSNMVLDNQANVSDRIFTFKTFYKDVQINMNPSVGGRPPYSLGYAQMKNPIVFRPDGRAYTYNAGVYTPLLVKENAVAVESLTLPAGSNVKAEYKWRFVEIDPLGSVRLIAKGSQGT